MAASDDFNARIIEVFCSNAGRVGGMCEGNPLLLLHHRGARSGVERINPLAYAKDGGRYVIFAAKGGAPQNPDWYHSLMANPHTTIEVGSDEPEADASEASGEERDRLFGEQAERTPQFGEYAEQTGGRVIPVVLLTPAG